MKHLTIIILLSLVGSVGLAHAQSGGSYDLEWNTVDGGGYMLSTGGNYALGGTAGQADAGALSGGAYRLKAGFWGGSVPAAPIAGFSARPRGGLAPLTVQFSDSSTGGANAWLWDFGDTLTSTEQHPTHVYANTGVYTVSLTVYGPGGHSDTLTRPSYVLVTPLSVSQAITPASSGLYTFGNTCARVYFTNTGSLTAVTVTLVYTFPTVQLHQRPLPRRYDIAGNGTGYAAMLGLCYDEDDLSAGDPIGNENALQAYRHRGGGAWDAYPSIRDTSANYVTATRVISFSTWSIGALGNAPTSVTLDRLGVAEAGVGWPGVLAVAGLLAISGLMAIMAWWGWRARHRRS